MSILAGVLVFAVLGGATPDAPEVPLDIQEKVHRYAVAGGDVEELRRALDSHALAERAGGSHGRTRSSIRISYAPEPVSGGCRLKDPAIRMKITTTLPEWPTRDPHSQTVKAALERHEGRHREHALAAARELQAAMAQLGAQRDCHALRRAVDRAFQRATMKARFRDERYDERTRDGLEEDIEL